MTKNNSNLGELASVAIAISDDSIIAQSSNLEQIADKPRNTEINLENISELGFKSYVLDKFVSGSGILPCLASQCLDFASELEFSHGGDISRPIAQRLGWDEGDWKRFGHNHRVNHHAAFIKQEDGSDWQAIINRPKDGKPCQYLAPKGIGDVPFLPPIPYEVRKLIASRFNLSVGGDGIPTDGSFWDWLSANPSIPVTVTEGAKKALALLSQGIPALAIYGISCGVLTTEDGYKVKPYLERFIHKDRVVIVAMDNDSNGSDTARRNNKLYKSRLVQAIQACEAKPRLMQWTADYKGIDDLIVSSPEKFLKAWNDAIFPQSQSKVSKMVANLEYRFGSRLRFNELTQNIEIDHRELDLDTAKVFWGETFGEDATSENIIQSLLHFSKQNAYNPVKDWLLAIETSLKPSQDFNRIASKYLGNDSSLANIYLKKTMIGAVARILNPGCKLDTCTVLQGKQGLGKSSFWAALAGKAEFFDDSLSAHGSGDKDEKLKIARFWILELAELESLYRRKDVSSVRSLLSSASDNIRLPYGRSIKSFPRHSIFVGSVNPSDFLSDSEGNRRFWVVPVESILLPSTVEVMGLWAAAIQSYRAGEAWWLNKEEEELQRNHNQNFEQGDTWEPAVLRFAENQEYVSIPELLSEALQLPLAMQSRRELNRVTDILKRHGYSRTLKRMGTKINRVWVKLATTVTGSVTPQNPVPVSVSDIQASSSVTGSVTGSVTPQNPVPVSVSDIQEVKCNRVTDKLEKNKNHTEEIEEKQKAPDTDSNSLCTFSNFSENHGYTVTHPQKPVPASDSGVTEPVTEPKSVTVPIEHFLFWDRAIDDTSEDSIDWTDILFPPRGLWDCQHLILQEGAPVWCPGECEIGFIYRVVLDDDDQIKIWEVVGVDGRERPWYPGECEPA